MLVQELPRAIDLLEAFSTKPAPLDFVLPGMLAGTVGSLVSPGGVGKSYLSLEWAVLVATGVNLMGLDFDVKCGRVVMLCAEDPADALKHRLHALGAHLDVEARRQMSVNVDVFPLVGHPFDLMKDSCFDWTLERACGRRLMLIDTLRRIHVADENDGGEMAALLGQMERITARTGCSILFLHHTTKAAALNGQGDMQQASRGSSVLTDNIRWQAFLGGMTKEEAKEHGIPEQERGQFVRFGIPKRNYGAPMPDLWLRRGEGGVLVSADLTAVTKTKPRTVTRLAVARQEW
jgi:RecA-family ATPase